jgi:hypothetical protein
MKHLNRSLAACILILFALACNQAFAQTTAQAPKTKEVQITQPSDKDLNIRAYIELLRSEIKPQVASIVAEVMQLDGSEAEKFWPIYREYEAEITKLGDKRMALIKEYSDNYENLTDETADRLGRGALDLDQARADVKKRYYERLKQALSAKTAARFMQVTNQILMLIDLQIASSLPVIR